MLDAASQRGAKQSSSRDPPRSMAKTPAAMQPGPQYAGGVHCSIASTRSNPAPAPQQSLIPNITMLHTHLVDRVTTETPPPGAMSGFTHAAVRHLKAARLSNRALECDTSAWIIWSTITLAALPSSYLTCEHPCMQTAVVSAYQGSCFHAFSQPHVAPCRVPLEWMPQESPSCV